MIWLLLQIGLCLLLAALAGWFLGWSMQGFRETERVEDLRQTLSATVDVKDRQLSESYRQVESLQSRSDALERANRNLEARVSDAKQTPTPEARSRAMLAPPASPPMPEAIPERSRGGAAVEVLEDARQRRDARTDLAAERRLRAEAETALRDKASALVAVQAEVEGLREAVDERASQIAELESRVIELEPLQEQLRRGEARVSELQAELARRAESEPVAAQDDATAKLQEQLNARDLRINELRVRVNDLRAQLDATQREARDIGDRLAERSAEESLLQRQLEEAERKLQRQIERNRKQVLVHRSVVENLQNELETMRGDNQSMRQALESHRAAGVSDDEHWREALADRETKIAAYRRRLAELEQQRNLEIRPEDRDDLQRIRGIGPVFELELNRIGVTRFVHIAQWNADDIKRVAAAIETNPKRITGDRWVESARKLR